MGHIHTEPYQHDLTTSAYIFRLDDDEPRILLHNHLKLGGYMQFGGHVELDEHPWQAIAREVREEAGYDLDQLRVLQPYQGIQKVNGIMVLPQPAIIINVPYGKTVDHFHDDIGWAFVHVRLLGIRRLTANQKTYFYLLGCSSWVLQGK